jgi:myo-inositol-1(or 4)-monophosphatase
LNELEVTEKGVSDFVSSADCDAQALIASELASAVPDAALVMEEDRASHALQSKQVFFVDPLDGTTNFLHGIPHFAVSIGYQCDGVLCAGVVFDPAKDEMFCAERGRGAFLGERRLHVSREVRLERALVGTGVPHRGRGDHERYLSTLPRVMSDVAGIRRMGSAALDLAYVAAGRFEAFFETGLSSWDIAAGVVLVEEAAGRVTRPDGEPFVLAEGDVLATNDALISALSERLSALSRG